MVAFTARPELEGRFGMVASTHYLGSAAGMAVLEAGGTAIDAAVATGFTLQVVEPHLNGPGGDMSLLFAPRGGRPVVLCGQGPAPAAATIEAYTSHGLDQIPGSGPLAAAIPGSTVAWLTLLRDHGTMPLASVLGYAIHYAEQGYPVLASITNTVTAVAELLQTEWTTSAAQYLAGGRPPQPGERLTNPAQAATYRRLLDAAAGKPREAGIDAAIAAWREGFVAEAIDSFCRTEWMDSSGARHAGVLTGADLAGWTPAYEKPATAEFAGLTIAKTGPWGQGPVLLAQLVMLDGLDLQVGTADFVHTVVEVAKLAFADRNAYYGDGGDVPLDVMLSPEYAASRRELVGETASLEMRPGSPGGRTPVLPTYPGTEGALHGTTGEPTVPRTGERTALPADAGTVGRPTGRFGGPVGEPVPDPDGRTRGDTCHIDVVDRWGTMVSATPSGGWLQSSPIIPALGFPLGTRLQMSSLQPGLPTTLQPGRRPRTTLSPSMAVAGDATVLAFGTPGGDQQDQWQLPFLLAHLTGGLNLQEAIDAPSFHTTHFASSFHPHEAHPGQVVIEDRFDPAVLAQLRRRGHRVVESGPWTLGRLSAVSRDPGTGVLRAAANPRGMQGYAVGR
jgi:gamma-glutamyltranspeptidase/glutathione hydrolase